MNPVLRHAAAHLFVPSLGAPALSDDDLHHLRVVRVRPTDTVTLSDGQGAWVTAVVDGGSIRVTSDVTAEPEPRRVTVATAIPKGDRPEWLVQKLTELGVARIVLVDCERSVVRWDGARAARHLQRLRRVAREAAMQSRRVWLPEVEGVLPFAEVSAGAGVALAELDGGPLASDVHTLVVGPEGGFSTVERSCGRPLVGLSAQVLRVETAALVAATRLQLLT